MIIGANGFAVSQPTPPGIPPGGHGVSVARIVNGSAQYLPGDRFTVELDYTVTGTQYAVSIRESLPGGWTIEDSSVPFKRSGPNGYTWNISSPLAGVGSGSIFYLVHIPDDALDGGYEISGDAGWFHAYSDVEGGVPTDTDAIDPDPTHITVGDTEGNGPTIWISTPTEQSGDGDGYLEAGETAQFNFDIWDPAGIKNYTVLDDPVVNVDPGQSHISGTASVPLIANSDPNILIHMFSIQAWDTDNNEGEFTLPVYVPNYDYTAWAHGEWEGFAAATAAFEPYNSTADGGWTYLNGGNSIKVPDVSIYYDGSSPISGEGTGLPGIGGIALTGTTTVNATPRNVNLPYSTYPVYSEYQGKNDVSAVFNGTQDMLNKEFHVILVNLSSISGHLDLTNISSIKNTLNGLTPEDIKNGEMGNATKLANVGSSDFYVTGADIHALNGMSQGVYALLVLDYGIPNVPCLVSTAPFAVTKNGLATTRVGPIAMPGSPVTLSENLLGDTTPGTNYTYLVTMAPEDDSSLDLHVTTDGTEAGTTLTVHGTAGDYTFTPEDLKNSTKLQEEIMAGINESNMRISINNSTTETSKDITLFTGDTMPMGNYTVTSIVLDRDTGNVAAINQTTIQLGATFTMHLVKEWNLISLPITPDNDSIYSVFPDDVRAKIVDIWGYDENTQDYTYYTADPNDYFYQYYPGITRIETGRGYWVYMSEDATVEIQGTIPDSAPNRTIAMHSEWNLVGPTGLTSPTPAYMYPNVVVIWGWDNMTQDYTYYTADPNDYFYQYYPNIDNTEPGQGYWVYMPLGGV